jgi:hypothetical protein
MICSDGGSSRGEEDTTVVASERIIMLKGKTERGARLGSKFAGGGTAPGNSATVDDLRSEE